MKEQDLKAKVIESLKGKGYHESQLKELNPIVENTINATRQALNLHFVSNNEVACCGNCHLPLDNIEYVPKMQITDKKYNP